MTKQLENIMKTFIYKTLLVIAFFLCLFASQTGFCAEKLSVFTILSDQPDVNTKVVDGFKESLNKNGVVFSMQVIVLSEHKSEEIIQKIKDQKPDIIFTSGRLAYEFTNKVVDNTPVVSTMIFLNNLNDVKSNFSVVTLSIPAKSKIEVVKKILPKTKKIGIFYSKSSVQFYRDMNEASFNTNIELLSKEIENEQDLSTAFPDIAANTDCFFIIPDNKVFFLQSIKYLLLESLRYKLPVIGLSSFFTKAGALMSLECDYSDIGRQSGDAAVKLREQQVKSLGIIYPRVIGYTLNVHVAERLNIKFSDEVINGASEVFGK
jgi:ABC-type uncharacterized transport system substrate-binding protein